MDRRNLHKANAQKVGKNKEVATRTRATNRAARQDALRELQPEVEVEVKPSRFERLQKWRLERDEKKKKEDEQKRKPFVTVVKKGVFTDKTNYVELNRQRRKKAASNKVNVQAQNVLSTARKDIAPAADMLVVPDPASQLNSTFDMQTLDHSTETPAVDLLVVPDRPSEVNITFETESVENNSMPDVQNQSDVPSTGIVKADPETIESTPTRPSLNMSFNYVSPFVTIGRGKGSAHKEVKVRESFYKLELSQPQNLSPLARQNREAAVYFRFQVNGETENLNKSIDYWDIYKNKNHHVDSVYLDQIDVAIGQTRLLIAKKFKQFLNLCDECEKGISQPPVLPKDLEGFWSMVFMQVDNCNERFRKLETLKENDWIEVDLLPLNANVNRTKNRKATKKETSASSGIQKMIEEARLKMKENRITTTAPTPSKANVANAYGMTLRQTPARLSSSAVTPKSIIKAKTSAGQRNPKSVAFSFIESPTPKAAATPKPRVITRRASTSGIPSEKQSGTADRKTTFLTPSNRKVPNGQQASPSVRRSHRRLFSVTGK